MNNGQSVVVYRSQLEKNIDQALWNGNSIVYATGAFISVFILVFSYAGYLKVKTYINRRRYYNRRK